MIAAYASGRGIDNKPNRPAPLRAVSRNRPEVVHMCRAHWGGSPRDLSIISEDRAMTSRGLVRAMLLGFLLLPALAGLRLDAASAQSDPAQELTERWAPLAVLRDQTAPCDRDGEGYFPAPVESVLGNPEVALKIADTASSATDTIVKMAPTAQDIANLDDQYYLDFPGNPRRPGCVFETDFKEYAAAQGLKPTTYAHIVVDEEEHRVVIQYWLWWYFNDWNNLHEGDWEVMQVVFDADSIEGALNSEPIRYAYAQHGGGELADPGDRKLRLVDGHPVIYPAAGSHATHYEQELYPGVGREWHRLWLRQLASAGHRSHRSKSSSCRTIPIQRASLAGLPSAAAGASGNPGSSTDRARRT